MDVCTPVVQDETRVILRLGK